MSDAAPDISLVDQWLTDAGSTLDAPEAHGILCGILCAQGAADRRIWLEQVVGEGNLGNAGLNALFEVTAGQFSDRELEFALLLPDDDQPLSERAVALRRWTQGYLFGIGLGGINQESLPEELYDFLRDLLEVAKVDFDTDEATEEDEEAYLEVLEFVRLGAITVFEELNPAAPPSDTAIH